MRISMEDVQKLKNKTKNMRVLFIDDDDLARESTFTLLNSLLGKVMTAKSGEEGLEIYKRYALQFFNLVITDITMDDMNGLEMIKKIKEFNPNQKTIIISAHNEYKSQATIVGVDDYIVKPIKLHQLLGILNDVLDLK